MASCGTFQKLRPLSLLTHLSSCYDSAHLQVSSSSVTWSIYLEQGKVTYASHSVDPFDRLDRHLRRLSHQIPTLSSETRAQLRLMFETDSESQLIQNSDYQGICWLVSQQYLSSIQAAQLIEGLAKEAIESFILVKEGSYELGYQLDVRPEFCRLELQAIVEYCQKQLQGWQSLGPEIWSPYQRPYFSSRTKTQQLPLELQERLGGMLRGFSFQHLAVLLNQNELNLAQSLHPYIVDGIILLHEPELPFNQLPKTFDQLLESSISSSEPLHRSAAPVGITTKTANSSSEVLAAGQLLGTPKHLVEPVDKLSTPIRVATVAKSSAPPSSQSSVTGQLPKVPTRPSTLADKLVKQVNASTTPNTIASSDVVRTTQSAKKTYTIVCVDDSPTMLKEISYFLDDESFSVFTISDSVKALMQIIRHKPDLILLDVRMSTIDGYELCRLLRNHSLFKNTPIIMVTGNTGLIDRVKARLVGASGYLTKPFTQSELLKMVFRHLA